MTMFTPEAREKIRAEILGFARNDMRLSGGAVTGSAVMNQLDEWSDIDLAFGVKASASLADTLADYSERMYSMYGAIHHVDVRAGTWIYRVFLLKSTLQVDLAFAPECDFGARAPTFRLEFGKADSNAHNPPAEFETLVGMCWLYALHARSSIRRARPWQAEFFISGMRDHVISLLCRRNKLPLREGRGVDRLPVSDREPLAATLIRSLETHELKRAFARVTERCLREVEREDPELLLRLLPAFSELADL